VNKQLVGLSAAVAAVALVSGADYSPPQFVDIARQAGVLFHHTNGASAEKHLVETMGSGGLFFDYDGDGWIDIFLVDGGSIADAGVNGRARHRLYHNRGLSSGSGQVQFEDVTDRSCLQHLEYGMGACAGDYDGDGRPDLYITNYGPNALYRNRGDGTFENVTAAAHVGDSRWSTGCAFADLDGDGDLDLWVVNYVDADRADNPFCGDARRNLRFYCHPLRYNPLPSTVYRNDGGGVFTDVSTASGVGALRANGLGVVIADYDNDGRPDVFVANDTMPNFLFHNDGGLRFTETGLASGIAVAADGKARAGMGIDTGDYDGDGQLDLVVTNLDFEMHTLRRGLGRGLFGDATTESGIGFPTLPFVGFGVAFLDFDNDGQLDIAIANGHILDNAPLFRTGSTYLQRKLLFHNTTLRRFVEVGRTAGPAFAAEKVGRGLAVGDIDNDGDLDLLVTNNGQDAELLRNDGGNRANALLVQLRGAGRNTQAIGARIRLTAGSRTQIRDVKAGSSYLSQNDLRAHFGLGAAARADRLEVLWPSGRMETVADVPANQIITIEEGRSIVARQPFSR
jgi:enediyne biosynthesis protein E4